MEFVAHEKKKGKTQKKKEERKRSFSTSCHCFHYMITTSTLLRQYCIALEEISINKMGTKKMKGIYKGFNKYISQMFVVKEHELQIGNPTDVKHVAHIGWDGQSSSAPIWMNEFKTTSDFSSTPLNNMCDSTWSSQEFEKSFRREQDLDPQNLKDSSSLASTTEEPQSVPKKQKRKKTKSSLSDKNSSRSTSTLQSKTSFAASSREQERRRVQHYHQMFCGMRLLQAASTSCFQLFYHLLSFYLDSGGSTLHLFMPFEGFYDPQSPASHLCAYSECEFPVLRFCLCSSAIMSTTAGGVIDQNHLV
ncbi:hypothetical protein MKX01_022194 [Papaver californicum]|nr:hypothetical protein MKX01_022194 [Papaver californicum]